MDFERREDKRGFRFYKPEDQDTYYPSVTTVKGIVADKGLQDWFKHSSAEEIRQKTQKGIDVGNVVHERIEELLEQGTTSIEDVDDDKIKKDASKYLQGFINFYDSYDLEIKELEVPVLNSKFGIAGTIDFVGWVDGELSLVDWKTSNSKDMLGWTHQLTSYATSDPFRDKDLEPNLYICHLKKRTKKGYQLREIDYNEELVDHITSLFKYKYDGEPSFPEEIDTEFQVSDSDED